jgi:hypothetical protein
MTFEGKIVLRYHMQASAEPASDSYAQKRKREGNSPYPKAGRAKTGSGTALWQVIMPHAL